MHNIMENRTKGFPAIFLMLAIMMAATAMATPTANATLTRPLYADGPDTGYSLLVGQVVISTTATGIDIQYQVYADWNITEVHCEAGTWANMQAKLNKNGNPKIGIFDCNVEFAPGSEVPGGTPYTCHIPFSEIGTNTGTIYVACQAVVQVDESALTNPAYAKYVVDGVAVEETAWAGMPTAGDPQYQFGGSSWAMYITYVIGS